MKYLIAPLIGLSYGMLRGLNGVFEMWDSGLSPPADEMAAQLGASVTIWLAVGIGVSLVLRTVARHRAPTPAE